MNSGEQLAPELRTMLRIQQVIVAAMAMGVLVFLMVALAMHTTSDPPEMFGMLTMIATGAAVAGLAARAVVPVLIVRTQRQRIARGEWKPSAEMPGGAMIAKLGPDGALMMLHQLRVIVGSALIEGAAFLAIIAFFIEGSPVAAGLAVLLAASLFVQFPTQRRVAAWLAEQRQLLEEEKLLGRSTSDV